MLKPSFQKLKQLNRYAMLSCTRWNKCRFLRRIYRKKYRQAAENYAMSPEGQERTSRYKAGDKCSDTYPWPYCDHGFANWPEDDSPSGYTLISDPSGCVIRYATSYVAWKIREEIGAWPQKKTSMRLDANHWQQFLAEAGYEKEVGEAEVEKGIQEGHHYVGIKPDYGEWGLVIWAEGVFKGSLWASTYEHLDEHSFHACFPAKKWADTFTWVQIN